MIQQLIGTFLILVFTVCPALAQPKTDQFGDPLPAGALSRCGTVRIRMALMGSSVEWSPDGMRLWTVAASRVQSWDVATGRELSLLDSIKMPLMLQPFPDGKRLAVLSNKSLSIVEIATQKILKTFPVGIGPIGISRDGSLLAIGEVVILNPDDNRIHLIDTKTLQTRRTIVTKPRVQKGKKLLQDGYRSVALLPDRKTLLTIGVDKQVRLWNVNDGKQIRIVGAVSDAAYNRLWISADGETLITTVTLQKVVSVQISSGKKEELMKLTDSKIHSFDVSRDGKLLAVTGENGVTRIWELRSKKLLQTLKATQRDCRFSPDGNLLAIQGLQVTEIWDWRKGRRVDPHVGHTRYAQSLAFSSDSRQLFSIGADATFGAWNAETGKLLRLVDLKPDVKGRRAVSISSAGGRFAVINLKKGIELRSVEDGRVLQTYPIDAIKDVYGLTFSPDGEILAVHRYDKDCGLLKLKTGKVERSFPQKTATSATFRADGKQLVLTQAKGFDHVEAESGKLLGKYRAEQDGEAFYEEAICSFQRGIVVLVRYIRDFEKNETHGHLEFYGLKDNRPLRTLKFPRHVIYGVAISPDGKLLAAAMGQLHGPVFDGSPITGYLGIWDVASGKRLWEKKLPHAMNTIVFSPDGRKLATGSMATDILIWDVPAIITP